MIDFSALDRLFLVKRERRRQSSNGDWETPLVYASQSIDNEHPYLVTNTKGQFVQGRIRPDGAVWAAFAECEIQDGGNILRSLHQALKDNNRTAASVLAPKINLPMVAIMSYDLLEAAGVKMTMEEARTVMLTQGHLAKISYTLFKDDEGRPQTGEMVVLVDDMDPGTAIVGAHPALCGELVRTDRFVAVIAKNYDRSLVAIG